MLVMRLEYILVSFFLIKSQWIADITSYGHNVVVNPDNNLMESNISSSSIHRRQLDEICNKNAPKDTRYQAYFKGIKKSYRNVELTGTCLPVHMNCGWPSAIRSLDKSEEKLPLFVLSVGLEGAGHHLWTEIFSQPLFDCVWINGRHYNRQVGDGVPRTTIQHLRKGIEEQFKMRLDSGKKSCKSIYDAEDSFPTGAIRKTGRVFMRPDLVNLQQLDGILFNLKYLIILRNTTV